MILYYAYFHTKVQYDREVYGTATKKHINRIEILQHKAIKALFNLEPLTSSRLLSEHYKLLSIKDLYSLKIANFVHRQQNNSLPSIFSTYFRKVANENYPNTRSRNKLLVPKSKIENEMKMVKHAGAKIWNKLTDELGGNLENMNSNYLSKKPNCIISQNILVYRGLYGVYLCYYVVDFYLRIMMLFIHLFTV